MISGQKLLMICQVRFEDPTQEWKLHNAWFVKQLNFNTVFKKREIVQPVNVTR
jgi:hypothetical protein